MGGERGVDAGELVAAGGGEGDVISGAGVGGDGVVCGQRADAEDMGTAGREGGEVGAGVAARGDEQGAAVPGVVDGVLERLRPGRPGEGDDDDARALVCGVDHRSGDVGVE